MTEPNPVEEAFDAAPVQTGEHSLPPGTVEPPAPSGVGPEAVPDYEKKFKASSTEALRLKAERDAEKARADAAEAALAAGGPGLGDASEPLYPGFEELDEEAQRGIRTISELAERRALERVYQDPAIAHARETFNRKKFDDAFERVAASLPALRENADEFKAKYFNPQNVPDNIESILTDVGKSYLYDKAHDLGAQEERERQERIDLERGQGGEPPVHVRSRTLEEWDRMREENPARFASLHKEYRADLESGKLGE